MARLLVMALAWTWLMGSAALFAEDDDHHPVAHAEADHGTGGHAKEKPQLPVDFRGDLALWSGVTFLLFLFVLTKMAWGPLVDGLNAREAKIRQDIADAESNRVKAEALFREYELKLAKSQDEVKEILSEARRDAEHAKQEILTAAEKESSALRQRAVSDIERARDLALNDLFDYVSQNVMQATEQVVGRSLTGTDHERLVREALTNLDLRKN